MTYKKDETEDNHGSTRMNSDNTHGRTGPLRPTLMHCPTGAVAANTGLPLGSLDPWTPRLLDPWARSSKLRSKLARKFLSSLPSTYPGFLLQLCHPACISARRRMDRTMRVHARPQSGGDKFPHMFASMLAASFGSMFGEKFSTLFLATYAKRFLSRSV